MVGKSGTARLARRGERRRHARRAVGTHRIMFKGPQAALAVGRRPDGGRRQAGHRRARRALQGSDRSHHASDLRVRGARTRDLSATAGGRRRRVVGTASRTRHSCGARIAARVKVAVIGAGSWGTAVAAFVAANAPTTLWARRPELAEHIDREHENTDYLPGIALPGIAAVDRRSRGRVHRRRCRRGRRAVARLPRRARRGATLHRAGRTRDQPVEGRRAGHAAPHDRSGRRGARRSRHRRASACSPVRTSPRRSRPGQPTASVVATTDAAVAEELQQLFLGPTFRVYTNPDVVGCEIAGTLKNVLAIGAGIAHGLGYGDNTKAALITRGLAELARARRRARRRSADVRRPRRHG